MTPSLIRTATAAALLVAALPTLPQQSAKTQPMQREANAIKSAAIETPAALPVSTPEARIRVLLSPTQETTLASPNAAKIKKFAASLGSKFVAGQTLIEFDCDEPIARVGMARAELAGAVRTHEAKVRMQGLDQASDVEVALAASAVSKARAQLALHSSQVKQCSVKAPWTGRISKVHVREHMNVTPGQAIVDLVKSGALKLRLNVPSSAFSLLKPGYAFSVKIDETGQTYKAAITAVNSRIDAVSQTIEVEAMMAENYPGLLAGMSGTATLGATP